MIYEYEKRRLKTIGVSEFQINTSYIYEVHTFSNVELVNYVNRYRFTTFIVRRYRLNVRMQNIIFSVGSSAII